MQLTGLLDVLRQTEAYQIVLRGLHQGQAVPDQHVLRSARPYVVAALARDLDRPILWFAGRENRAHNITEQFPVWLPERPIQRFAEPTATFYERSPWTESTIYSRVNTLAALANPVGAREDPDAPQPVIVASAYALMQKTMPLREFIAGSRALRVGSVVEPEALLRTWLQFGYEPASVVVEPGTFSRRGGILDIFPMAAREPVRIEFWGDEIESLRTFNPATQRSAASIERITITPAREALPRYAPAVAERLSEWFAAQPVPDDDVTSSLPDQDNLINGIAFPLLEFYLPYLYTNPASLLSYAPDDALIVIDDWGGLEDSIAELEERALDIREDRIA
jgi:transcription-repair coupling factor (superfamily II helicase)